MSDEPNVPSGFRQFPGQSPHGSETAWFLLDLNHLEWLNSIGLENQYLESIAVPQVVESPTSIWKDLQRDGQEFAFCYAGKPKFIYRRNTRIEVPPPKNMVFAVFISPTRSSGGQFIVSKWTFIKEAPDKVGFPINYEDRFGEQVWPQD